MTSDPQHAASGLSGERLSEDSAASQRQMLLDLNHRAHMGLYAHCGVWLLIVWLGGLYEVAPVFAWSVFGCFALHLAIRVLMRRSWEAIVQAHLQRARLYAYGLLLWPALQWGLLVAVAALRPAIGFVETPLLLMMCSLSSVGTSLFGISALLRYAYPLAMLGPITVVTAATLDASNRLLMALLILFLFYLHGVGKRTHADYWAALSDRHTLARYARQQATLSTMDSLTQLHNRFHFDRRLAAEWARAQREAGVLSLLVIDLEHFKKLNDTHGHPFGDRCLQEVALALGRVVHRASDVVARYGGEEFVALLPGTDGAAAAAVAGRLLQAVAAIRLAQGGETVAITCSIGGATLRPARPDDSRTLVETADAALYTAKKQGRNRYAAAGTR